MNGSTEELILVDEEDNEIGTASREECHRGSGLRHRAFVLLIENARAEVLLQQRPARKLGGGRWDVSATSHVRRGESYDSAIARCVAHELGIAQSLRWLRVLSYVYMEPLGDRSENEFCVLYSARYDGTLRPNDCEIDAVRWIHLTDLVAEIRTDPVLYTAWLREAATRAHAAGAR